MQKQMSYKKIIICICAAAAVIAAAVIVLLLNRGEAYRSILVYEVEGTAVIERENVGSMNAAQNLYLESGDRVSVAQASSMRMKLDDDKYVMAEADTIFSVEAEGTDDNSKTRICLEQGAITNEIQHPLSQGSQYETSTPNSVMAVRGTIYRVELYADENGDRNTKMSCFQGKVGATPILPDGTFGEEVLVPAGSELVIYSDGTVGDVSDIAYEELPAQSLQFLKSMLEDGQSMEGITLENIDGVIAQTADISEEVKESKTEQAILSDAAQDSAQENEKPDTDAADNSSVQAGKDAKVSATSKTAADQSVQEPQITEETQPKVSGQVQSDNSGEDSSQSENGGDSFDNNNEAGNNSSDDYNSDNNRSDNHTPAIPPQKVVYTVTFEYQGTTFATQQVKSGEKVSAPTLVPAQSGEWDFDFGTVIKANTTIKWKE